MRNYDLRDALGVRVDVMYSGDNILAWVDRSGATPVWILRPGADQFEPLREMAPGSLDPVLTLGHRHVVWPTWSDEPGTHMIFPSPQQLVVGCTSVDNYCGTTSQLALQTLQTLQEDAGHRFTLISRNDEIIGFHRVSDTITLTTTGLSPHLKRITTLAERRPHSTVSALSKLCRDGLLYSIRPNSYFACRDYNVRVCSPHTLTWIKTYAVTFPVNYALEDFDVSADGSLMAFAVRCDDIAPRVSWELVLSHVRYMDEKKTVASVDTITTYSSDAMRVAFSPDGLTLAASCIKTQSPYGAEVHVYDVDT